MWIYSILLANSKNEFEVNNNSDKVYDLLCKNQYNGELPLNIGHALINILNRATPVNDNARMINVIQLYRKFFGKSSNAQVQQNLILFYFRLANIAFLENRKSDFYQNAIEYMRMVNFVETSNWLTNEVSISINTMKGLVNELYRDCRLILLSTVV